MAVDRATACAAAVNASTAHCCTQMVRPAQTQLPAQTHQGWNQSSTVLLTVAGKRWERTRKPSPTGEQVKIRCRLLDT